MNQRGESERDSHGPDPDRPSSWPPVPSWLLVPGSVSYVPPPLESRAQTLPFGELSWEDFERLCLRLLQMDAERLVVSPAGSGLYGRKGQAQDGIDVYARDPLAPGEAPPTRRFVTLQSRRTKEVTPAKIRASVEDFLAGKWAAVSRTFIYVTSASARSTDIVDDTESLTAQLIEEGISFEVWDQEVISERLKALPEVVDDFFGRTWVKRFCGEDAAEALGTRLDANQVAEFRSELARVYRAAFGVADSGLIAFRFSEAKPVELLDRFVTPDLVSTTLQAASSPQDFGEVGETGGNEQDFPTALAEAAARNRFTQNEDGWFMQRPPRTEHRLESSQVAERRSANQWIGESSLQVIVGDPGAGKSTLLRYLVLDLLSEEPSWRTVAERWGQRLPVWLPFHFFTQRVEDQTGAPASVGQALQAWLDQHDAGHLWPLVRAALGDKRLLLVVDGLDEWISHDAGRAAFATLKAFTESRAVPVVASTRPYGLTRLTLDGSWTYSLIAPLTTGQQRQLASHFFHAVVDTEDTPSSAGAIERSLDSFLSQIHEASDLRAISGTPLFLVLLLGLHLSNVTKLPTGRFDVYDRAVQLLVADHPAQRRTAAAVTASRQRLSDQDLRRLLGRVAFVSQQRGDLSVLPERVVRQDFIEALRDPNDLAMDAASAAAAADLLLTVAEGELGLLVRRAPDELGFLHRMLQEELAAEHISNRLGLHDVEALFREHAGDPRWREVILATLWRIQRPEELRALTDVIRERIGETPTGLGAREAFAEIVFGPYGLPAVDVQRSAPGIVEVIETHPYAPHRARLLDIVLKGLNGTVTRELVRRYLERWALLVREPTPDLVHAIAQVPEVASPSHHTGKLLLRALQYPNTGVAFASAAAIAGRATQGEGEERDLLRTGLLKVLAERPSGLAASTALAALALGWRDDPATVRILHEARAHADESVRLVALSDAVGTLGMSVSGAPSAPTPETEPLTDAEREWLTNHLVESTYTDIHWGLLIATVSEVVRGRSSVIEDVVEALGRRGGPATRFQNADLLWLVALNVLADDPRVVKLVCEELRTEAYPSFIWQLRMGNRRVLAEAYPPGSTHNESVAAAIEHRLGAFTREIDSPELFGLAGVDRGPAMREALLARLTSASWPHWEAAALAEHFGDDRDVRVALRAVLQGDVQRASMVANVATSVLDRDEVIPRLLAVLRGLKEPDSPGHGRPDIVADALIEACQDPDIRLGPEFESIAEEALASMPSDDSRHELAAALYPSAASAAILTRLIEEEDRPLAPYLRNLGQDPEHVEVLLGDAATILCSLPAYLRARVCQVLGDLPDDPEVVMRLTRRWAEEVWPPNRSIASLAYHRALMAEKAQGRLGDQQWEQAQTHLQEQVSWKGIDSEASARAAWVGMCICGDWSAASRHQETRVELTDLLNGPDRTLLLQLASHWGELRSEFGEALLERFDSRWKESNTEVWGELALVAEQSEALQQELEDAVASNPDLLGLDGVLAWFVAREGGQRDAVAEALVSHLYSGNNRESLASVLLTEPERIGLDRDDLLGHLEGAPLGSLATGDPRLQALAVLFPEHPLVTDAWLRMTAVIRSRTSRTERPLEARTYFAVAYAASSASDVVQLIERDLDRLEESDGRYIADAFARYVTQRLRRDRAAADLVRDSIMNPTTTDSRAAALVSLVAEAIGLDEPLLREVERRIAAQDGVELAPIARDHALGATLSVRSVLTRVADAGWEIQAV